MDRDREKDSKKEKGGFFDLFGRGSRNQVSEEAIKDMVADNDELLEDEKRMIHDILDLGDMSVYEIMTPRVDMMLVEDEETGRTPRIRRRHR